MKPWKLFAFYTVSGHCHGKWKMEKTKVTENYLQLRSIVSIYLAYLTQGAFQGINNKRHSAGEKFSDDTTL